MEFVNIVSFFCCSPVMEKHILISSSFKKILFLDQRQVKPSSKVFYFYFFYSVYSHRWDSAPCFALLCHAIMEAPQKRRENAVVPMIECMDLFSRRQSIHHIRLPNLALNEQRYPALSCSAGGRQITLALAVALVLDSRCPQGRQSLLSLGISLAFSFYLPPEKNASLLNVSDSFWRIQYVSLSSH